MSKFTIRPATADDAERMAGIIVAGREQTYGLRPGSYDYQEMITNWRGRLGGVTMRNYMAAEGEWRFMGSRPRAVVAACLADAAIVGVMTSRKEQVNGQKNVNLDFLFVDPNKQGQGLGTQLLEDLTDYAGGSRQSLTVVTHNLRARALYERHGFEVVPGAVSGYPPLQFQKMVKPAVTE